MKKYIFLLICGIVCIPSFVQASPVILPVPFTAQAPEGNWGEPWDNACEETSMVMVENYYRGNWSLNVEKSKKEIQNVLTNKEVLIGKSKDESPESIVKLITEVYKREAEVVKGITIEKIKQEIDGGYPVIIAFDARLVRNANFIAPKPTYHVAVIVGYDDKTKQFIINEPGTSDGKHFRYGYDELLKANETYTVRDTGEVRGNEAVFTSSIRVDDNTKGILAKFFDMMKSMFH